ncbi:Hypothetical protein PP7435_CHR4-0772 [Komagataella phaffii CBS 7435]|uniref:Uncharacterized protein n=2 Tax=Komagataella phaffii TaxID=460519 RepID=C4R791_KOMPG|nr:Hypothetical protein PAS_chr4_0235 [Komagataella phaffii GS115]AOA65325.1 GQ67_04558T0 [Komagataella phaffii]CAH2451163.1 Hypothetical protein BQ9382_C4-4060 [Komagataella phaffii CBS 7435]AOA69835.1 GQ68_04530T0 [Komagataella phaffii GS115]CAY71466.1 Hypothetical protein PAS_chr4_0235 [Komagataella phaffii GS115]CCA40926.1 Hypothetical protein PP7435_CHR4-0772 [Komagataella phaffii CBS 7435]
MSMEALNTHLVNHYWSSGYEKGINHVFSILWENHANLVKLEKLLKGYQSKLVSSRVDLLNDWINTAEQDLFDLNGTFPDSKKKSVNDMLNLIINRTIDEADNELALSSQLTNQILSPTQQYIAKYKNFLNYVETELQNSFNEYDDCLTETRNLKDKLVKHILTISDLSTNSSDHAIIPTNIQHSLASFTSKISNLNLKSKAMTEKEQEREIELRESLQRLAEDNSDNISSDSEPSEAEDNLKQFEDEHPAYVFSKDFPIVLCDKLLGFNSIEEFKGFAIKLVKEIPLERSKIPFMSSYIESIKGTDLIDWMILNIAPPSSRDVSKRAGAISRYQVEKICQRLLDLGLIKSKSLLQFSSYKFRSDDDRATFEWTALMKDILEFDSNQVEEKKRSYIEERSKDRAARREKRIQAKREARLAKRLAKEKDLAKLSTATTQPSLAPTISITPSGTTNTKLNHYLLTYEPLYQDFVLANQHLSQARGQLETNISHFYNAIEEHEVGRAKFLYDVISKFTEITHNTTVKNASISEQSLKGTQDYDDSSTVQEINDFLKANIPSNKTFKTKPSWVKNAIKISKPYIENELGGYLSVNPVDNQLWNTVKAYEYNSSYLQARSQFHKTKSLLFGSEVSSQVTNSNESDLSTKSVPLFLMKVLERISASGFDKTLWTKPYELITATQLRNLYYMNTHNWEMLFSEEDNKVSVDEFVMDQFINKLEELYPDNVAIWILLLKLWLLELSDSLLGQFSYTSLVKLFSKEESASSDLMKVLELELPQANAAATWYLFNYLSDRIDASTQDELGKQLNNSEAIGSIPFVHFILRPPPDVKQQDSFNMIPSAVGDRLLANLLNRNFLQSLKQMVIDKEEVNAQREKRLSKLRAEQDLSIEQNRSRSNTANSGSSDKLRPFSLGSNISNSVETDSTSKQPRNLPFISPTRRPTPSIETPDSPSTSRN